jgi:hypothetical protein
VPCPEGEVVAVRPEDVHVTAGSAGTVTAHEPLGADLLLLVRLEAAGGAPDIAVRHPRDAGPPPPVGERVGLDVRRSLRFAAGTGEASLLA